MKFTLDIVCILWVLTTTILNLVGVTQISWFLVFLPVLLVFSLVVLLTIIIFCVTICFSISYACSEKTSLKEGVNAFKKELEELEKLLEREL